MLQGKKVTLRAAERDDLETLWRYRNDLELWILAEDDPPVPHSLAQLEARFEEDLNKDQLRDVEFVIEADEKVIGSCALFHVDPAAHTAELGIIIGDRAYWGRGYGRDAIETLLDYAFRFRNLRRIWLSVTHDNERALRSYKGIGFAEEGRQRQQVYTDGEFKDLIYMGLMREEWAAGGA